MQERDTAQALEVVMTRAAERWPELSTRISGAPQQWTKAFHASPLFHRAVAGGTAGLWRISVQGATPPISLIVKRIAPVGGSAARWQATRDPGDPFYWAREAVAYETGFFGDKVAGMRSARCYLVDQRDDEVDLYLEDVRGELGTGWEIARYALAAEQLGRFQAVATGLASDASWLGGTSFFEAYLARREELYARADAMVCVPAPHLEGEGLRELGAPIRRLWEKRERVLAFCAELPSTRCHNDFWSPNLFATPDADQTVAIDLAYAGLGAPGHDVANLVADAVLDFFVPASEARCLWDAVADSYSRGLSSGLSGEHVRAARVVMTLTAALKFGWLVPATFQVASTPEGVTRIVENHGDADGFFRKRSAALRFVGTLVDSSLRALEEIG